MSNRSAIDDLLAGIVGQLANLPEEKLLAVMEKIAALGGAPVVRPLLEEVRPRLRALRPPRPITLLRVLCQPFEDLLCADDAEDTANRVPRQMIAACWTVLETADAATMKRFDAELQRLPVEQPERRIELGERVWSRAAETLTKWLAEGKAGAETEALTLVRDTLAAGAAIEAFKRFVPVKPVARLGQTETEQIEAGLARLKEAKIPSDGFLLAVAARLSKPAELLAFRDREGQSIGGASANRLGEFAIADLVERGNTFAGQVVRASPNELAREADSLVQALLAVKNNGSAAIRAKLDAKTQEMMKPVQEALRDRVIDAAPAVIDAALNGEGAPAHEALIAAENHARALGRSRRAAAVLGLEARAAKAIGSVCKKFEAKIGELLHQAKTSDGTSAPDEQGIYRSIRMIELVDGPQHAAKLLLQARRELPRGASAARAAG